MAEESGGQNRDFWLLRYIPMNFDQHRFLKEFACRRCVWVKFPPEHVKSTQKPSRISFGAQIRKSKKFTFLRFFKVNPYESLSHPPQSKVITFENFKNCKKSIFQNLTLGEVSGPNFAPEVDLSTQKFSKLHYEAHMAQLKMVIFDFL